MRDGSEKSPYEIWKEKYLEGCDEESVGEGSDRSETEDMECERVTAEERMG